MSIVFTIASAFTLLFLLLVLFRNPKETAFQSYFLSGLLWVLILLGILFSLRWQLGRVGALLLATGVTFLPAQATLFTFCFARENPEELLKRWKWLLGLAYLASLLFLFQALQEKIYLLSDQAPQSRLSIAYSGWGRLFLGFLLLTTLAGLVNLESTYRLSKGKDRYRLKLPITFWVLTYAWLIYAASSSFVFRYLGYWVLQVGLLLIFLALLSTGAYLLRQKTHQPSIYMGQRIAYSSLAFLLVGLYLIFIGLVASLIPKLGGNLQIFISVLAALMVLSVLGVLVFWESWKKRLVRFLDRFLYPGRFDFREEWKNFSENISALLDADQIQKEIAKVITDTLGVGNVTILSRTGRSPDLVVTYPPTNSFPAEISLPVADPFGDWLLRYGETLDKRQLEHQWASYESGSNLKQILDETGAVVITPFIARRELVGILLVGPKSYSDLYTNEDFDLLNALSGQGAIALLNARIGQELILSREMESFHKFAAYVIHDLKNSISMLTMLLSNAQGNLQNPQFQATALQTIDQAVRKMKFLVDKLSSPPEGSTLMLCKSDLNEIITRAMRELKLDLVPNLKVENQLSALPLVDCDPVQMEKVFQNLLLNAVEALPKGGQIRVNSCLYEQTEKPGSVQISIGDNGVGISSEYIRQKLFHPFASTKKAGLGIGLYQSKEIVEQHGGRIWAESEPNKGTTFHIILPVERIEPSVVEDRQTVVKK